MANDPVITSYPLTWPEGWPKPKGRLRSKFKKRSIAQSMEELLSQLRQMRVIDKDIIISTNLSFRRDGLPYSGQRQPENTGVSVWWKTRGGDRKVIALGDYEKVEDNIYAIAMTLEAMRGIKRWGGGEMLDRSFAGFVALPAPGKLWRDVIGYYGNDIYAAKQAYFLARSEAHPDKGGSPEQFDAVEKAWTECEKELTK